MRLFSSLATAILATTAALLSAGAQAGPMPTNAAVMKSMFDKSTIEVGYRGGLGYRGLGYGAAGAVVGGAIARRAYYGDGGYYGGYGGDPSYGYAAEPQYSYGGGYGYGYGGCTCPHYGGYAARHYGW